MARAARGVGAVVAFLQRIVEVAHKLRGLFVGRVFGIELMLFVARNEKEVADVFVKIGKGKLE